MFCSESHCFRCIISGRCWCFIMQLKCILISISYHLTSRSLTYFGLKRISPSSPVALLKTLIVPFETKTQHGLYFVPNSFTFNVESRSQTIDSSGFIFPSLCFASLSTRRQRGGASLPPPVRGHLALCWFTWKFSSQLEVSCGKKCRAFTYLVFEFSPRAAAAAAPKSLL